MDWRLSVCGATALLLVSLSTQAEQRVDAYKLDASFLEGKHPMHVVHPGKAPSAAMNAAINAARKNAANNKNSQFGPGVAGIDSLANFTGTFTAPGLDAFGNPQNVWSFSYVGGAPGRNAKGSTKIDVSIIPITVELLDANGNVAVDETSGARLVISPTSHIDDVLQSPIYSDYLFTSSRKPTQYADAIHRATFFDDIDDNWHTLLKPRVEKPLVMQVPFGEYFYILNSDGSCCRFVEVDDPTFEGLLFPPTFPVDNSTLMGAAELSGAATTRGITVLLFQDIYLFENGDPKQCCVLGFHTFDEEPGTAKNGNLPRAYTMIYASWVGPGLFGTPELGFEDVVALSHETSELFADPFVVFDGVHNLTPWWFSGGNCQDNLETGDVVEGLATNVTFPIAGKNGFLYHPQNVALLQWFAFQAQSTALGGAYSYPDPGALPALSPEFLTIPDVINCINGNVGGKIPLATTK